MLNALMNINWAAVALATLAYYLLGALWFTPLFGRKWDEAVGFERTKGHRFPPLYYIVPLITSLVTAVATAALIYALDIQLWFEALLVGLVVGVGYAAAVSFNNAVTPSNPRPLLFGAVTGGYHVAGILLVAAVIFALK